MATPTSSVLIFYPHDFTRPASGTERRFVELLEYFADRRIPVDVYTLSGFSSRWDPADLARHGRRIRNLFVYDWPGKWRLAGRTLLRHLSGTLANHALPGLKRAFGAQAARGAYSHVLVSYAYWADLADTVPEGTIRVIDLHDILTFNRFHRSGARRFRLGRMLESELDRIAKFDAVLSISAQESTLLRSLVPGAAIHDVPMSFPADFAPEAAPRHDLIFVGSGNPFNVQGLQWFLSEVFPRLGPSTTMLVVGSVCHHVTDLPANVTVLPFADSLREHYHQSRLAVCPLSGGSGLKIKVVEALAHGKPVVANDAGLAGLPNPIDEQACVRADSPSGFAEAIRRLLADLRLHASACEAAQAYFLRHFGREDIWATLDRVFAAPEEQPH